MENNLEQKVEKIVISKVQLIIGLVIFIVPIIGFFFKIQMDVSLIKENHYVHIENIENQIKDLKEKDLSLEQKNGELLKIIIDYNSKLDQLIGAHNIKQ